MTMNETDKRIKSLGLLVSVLGDHGVSTAAIPRACDVLATCWRAGADHDTAIAVLIASLEGDVVPDGLRNALLANYRPLLYGWLGVSSGKQAVR